MHLVRTVVENPWFVFPLVGLSGLWVFAILGQVIQTRREVKRRPYMRDVQTLAVIRQGPLVFVLMAAGLIAYAVTQSWIVYFGVGLFWAVSLPVRFSIRNWLVDGHWRPVQWSMLVKFPWMPLFSFLFWPFWTPFSFMIKSNIGMD